MVCLAEPLEVDYLPLAQELDNVVYVRVIAEAQDVIVGDAGFLLCRQILRQISDQVALTGHTGGAVGESGGGGGVDPGGAVYEVGVKSGSLDLLIRQVPGQLMDDGADHFQMAKLLCPYIVLRNVPNQALCGQAQCFWFICT